MQKMSCKYTFPTKWKPHNNLLSLMRPILDLKISLMDWLERSFFVTSQSESKKGVNYRRKDDTWITFTSMKKTSSLNNIFTFKESEKSLKKTPLGFLFAMKGLTSLKRSESWLETLVLGLKSMTKMSKLVLNDFFRFMEVQKSKKKLTHNQNF